MPSGAVEDEDGVGIGADRRRQLVEQELHGRGARFRQDQGDAGVAGRADGAEDPGGGVAPVAQASGPLPAPEPAVAGPAALPPPALPLPPPPAPPAALPPHPHPPPPR